MNDFRLALFFALPLAVVLAVGLLFAEEVLFFAFLFWLALASELYWFSDRIVLRMCRAELLTVYHSPTIFRAVEELCTQADLPMPRIYMMQEEAPNVCSVGRNSRSSGLVFTRGILQSLNSDELRGAIAHELVHIYRRDTVLGSLAATVAGLLGMNSRKAQETASRYESSTSPKGEFGRFAISGIYVLLATLAATIIHTLVDGGRDFRADEFGARLTANPLAMASAIRIMEKKADSTHLRVVPAVAHLFMVSPARGGRLNRIVATHPPMEERIARLETLYRKTTRSNEATNLK